jgi:hypothetical protein
MEPLDSFFGTHEACAKSLQYTRNNLVDLISDHKFAKLQRSLKKSGAVTNELLRQNLPYVVKQNQQSNLEQMSTR